MVGPQAQDPSNSLLPYVLKSASGSAPLQLLSADNPIEARFLSGGRGVGFRRTIIEPTNELAAAEAGGLGHLVQDFGNLMHPAPLAQC